MPAVAAAAPPVAAAAPPVSEAKLVVADRELRFSFRDPDRRKKLEAAFLAVEKRIEQEMKKQGLPGLAFGIVIDGELAYSKGFGITSPDSKQAPDADTVYRIGSITKSFTALTVLALRDDGVLQLDDPLQKWIPQAAQLVYPTKDAQPITLRQLANHTSGLPRMGTFEPENGPSEAVVVDSLAKLPLESTPGTRWNYSNLGFGLLGIVISHAAKQRFEDVVAARIFKPLGMTSTSWDPPADKLAPVLEPGPKAPQPKPPARLGAIAGAGAIYSTVRDMAKYVAFQLSAYPPRSAEDRGPIRRATLREAHSTGVLTGLAQEPVAAAGYGFGWSMHRSCRFDDSVAHNGAIDSHRAGLGFSPSRGVGMVGLTNFPMGDPQRIIYAAFVELAKSGALEPRVAEASPRLVDVGKKLLAVYHQWDEAALKAILGRPIDPREQDELATYKRLHGACTDMTVTETDGIANASFAVKCERGAFELRIDIDGKGLILGFIGFSRDVEMPKPLATAAKAIVSLHGKWDDKLAAKYLAKTPVPLPEMKQLAAQFHERHGDCEVRRTIHGGFDWGYELACKKEDVEMMFTAAPTDPTQLVGINLRPVHGAQKKCD